MAANHRLKLFRACVQQSTTRQNKANKPSFTVKHTKREKNKTNNKKNYRDKAQSSMVYLVFPVLYKKLSHWKRKVCHSKRKGLESKFEEARFKPSQTKVQQVWA